MNHESNPLKAQFFAGLSARIADLHALAGNPDAFAQARRTILQEFFRTVDIEKQEYLHALQNQIDVEAAVKLSPDRMIRQLLELLNDQITELEAIIKRSIDNSACRKME